MKYIARVEEFATQSPSYIRIVTFEAKDDESLNKLLDRYAQFGFGDNITIDDSQKPARFDESGGFCSQLLSFVDENNRDVKHLEQGAF